MDAISTIGFNHSPLESAEYKASELMLAGHDKAAQNLEKDAMDQFLSNTTDQISGTMNTII